MSSSEDETEYQDSHTGVSNIDLLGSEFIKRDRYNNYYLNTLSDCKNFIENIEEFDFNSTINKKHILDLKESLKTDNHLTGVLTTVLLNNGNLILIDGHHRINAIKLLYKEDVNLSIGLDIHNYCFKDLNDPGLLKLFEKLNNTKPYKTNIDIVKSSKYIIDSIDEKYPKLFSDAKKRANFPRLHKREFNDKLQIKLKELLGSYNESIIIKKMKKLHLKLKSFSQFELINFIWDKYKDKSYCDKIVEKYSFIQTNKCYLGCYKIDDLINDII